jgi:hypothetical protein
MRKRAPGRANVCVSLALPFVRDGHEAARVHRGSRWRGGVEPESADFVRGGLDGCDYFARCQTCKVGPLPRRGAELASVRWSPASVSMRF